MYLTMCTDALEYLILVLGRKTPIVCTVLQKIRKTVGEKKERKLFFLFFVFVTLPRVKYAVDYKSMRGGYKPY